MKDSDPPGGFITLDGQQIGPAPFTLTGLALTRLLVENPVCVPTAVIVGDDDAASGIDLCSRSCSTPNFNARRIVVPAKPCNAGWPWLNQ